MESNSAFRNSDMHNVKSNVADASSKIKEGVMNLVGESKYVASLGQEVAFKTIQDGIDTVSKKTNQIACAVSDVVKEKPIQSIAIVAGVSFLLGGLFKRSRD